MYSGPNFTNINQHVKQIVLGISLLGLAFQISAQTQVEGAWVRATVPGQ